MSDAPKAPVQPRAIVIGHADFAAGLISAVDQITGCGAALIGLSIAGMTPEQMESTVASYVARGIKVIFTDLPGGSATTCSRRACGKVAGPVVVSGVSLPTLLDFVLSVNGSPEDALRAAERGRVALGIFGRR
jgi:PTS system N-acetylgalactosamine-specific IIA component